MYRGVKSDSLYKRKLSNDYHPNYHNGVIHLRSSKIHSEINAIFKKKTTV